MVERDSCAQIEPSREVLGEGTGYRVIIDKYSCHRLIISIATCLSNALIQRDAKTAAQGERSCLTTRSSCLIVLGFEFPTLHSITEPEPKSNQMFSACLLDFLFLFVLAYLGASARETSRSLVLEGVMK